MLELALQAARYAEDASAEAWALHQRGTRALCLGAADAALENLEDALVLREALGDVAGAAASRHNLEHVPGGAVLVGAPPPAPPALVQRAGPSPWFFLALALAAIALVTIVILAVVGRDEELEDSVFVVATSPVEYGSRVIGVTTDPRVIVIENGSDLPALVRAVRIQGGAASDFVVLRDDCTGRTLAPAEGCSIVAAFVPAAVGPRVADLVLDSEQGVRTVILSGVGATALPANEVAEAASSAPLEVTPARVDFGGQVTGTTGGPLPITFVNRSAGNARPVIRLDAGPSREFAIVEDLCTNSVVPPGQACIVEVVFRPRGGGLRGAVMIVRDATTNENWTVALTGRGEAETGDAAQEAPAPGAETPGPAAGFALAGPDMIAFGVQQPGTQSTVQTVTLENELDDEIRISNVRLSGLDARSFGIANDRCSGSILRPGGRCALDVWFLPDDEGEQRTSLVVRDGRGGVARETVITGTGG